MVANPLQTFQRSKESYREGGSFHKDSTFPQS